MTTFENIPSKKPEYLFDNIPKNTDADISNITKINFGNDKCPITDFKITSLKFKSPNASKLSKAFYNVENFNTTSKDFTISTRQKITELVKPIECKINFESDFSFNYLNQLSNLEASNYKILGNILNLYKSDNFIVNDNSYAYEGLTNSNKFYQSIGLNQIHNCDYSDEFITLINRFINETIKRIFKYKSSGSSKVQGFSTSALSDNEYYTLFKNIFMNSSDNKIKSWTVSSLLLPSIINKYTSDNIYDLVPKLSNDYYINKDTQSVFYPNILNGSVSSRNINSWNYPLISANINYSSGLLKVNENNNLSNPTNNLLSFKTSNDIIKFEKIYNFDYKNDNQIDLNKLISSTDKIKTETKTFNYTKDINIEIRNIGTIIINDNNVGNYCGTWGITREHGRGHGSERKEYPYYRIYVDNKSSIDLFDISASKDNFSYISGEGWSDRPGFTIKDNVKNTTQVISVKKCIDIKYIVDDGSRKFTCNGKSHNERNLTAKVPVNLKNALQWMYNNTKLFSKLIGIDFEFTEKIDIGNIPINLNSINAALKVLKPKMIVTKSGTFNLGNNLSDKDKSTIINDYAYSCESKTVKNYSMIFEKLINPIYVYDDRFYYYITKYFENNYINLCKCLEYEIYDALLLRPDLLIPYRIQQGYLNYILNKRFNGNTWINMECPIIGTMMHSDTTNMTEYNDYISIQNIDLNTSKIINTNDGIVVTKIEIPSEVGKNALDSVTNIIFNKFGNISDNNILPGIFMNDSSNPSDYISEDNIISPLFATNVDSSDPAKTYEELCESQQGSLVVFYIKDLINKGIYSDNDNINDSITKANSEKLNNLSFPYVCLIKEISNSSNSSNIIKYALRFSTMKNGNVDMIYYRQSEKYINDGNTYINYEHSISQNNQIIRFVKNYCGIFEKSTPFGKLRANNVINL